MVPLQNRPVAYLINLYDVDTDVMALILGVNRSVVDQLVHYNADPTEDNLAKLSEFFEIPITDLRRHNLPMAPDPAVAKKVSDTRKVRFPTHAEEVETISPGRL